MFPGQNVNLNVYDSYHKEVSEGRPWKISSERPTTPMVFKIFQIEAGLWQHFFLGAELKIPDVHQSPFRSSVF